MISRRDLMVMHIDALYTHDAQGRMVRVNEPNGKAAPMFHIGRTPDGNVWRFRHDLDADVVRDLEEACRRAPPDGGPLGPTDDVYGVLRALGQHRVHIDRIEEGPAFSFPEKLDADTEAVFVTEANADILRRYMAPWLGDVGLCDPFLAILQDGHAVSVCGSVRITDRGYEAGVDTHPDFRGRGLAPRVVSAWAAAVRAIDRVPLYSTSWSNLPSRWVASKLMLIQFGYDLHVS